MASLSRDGDFGCRLRSRRKLDLVKNQLRGRHASLYHNLGEATFEDTTFTAAWRAHAVPGLGCGFFDFDNDGWPDILICNGHVYPEVEQLKPRRDTRSANFSIATCAMAGLKMFLCKRALEFLSRSRRVAALSETLIMTATSICGESGQ